MYFAVRGLFSFERAQYSNNAGLDMGAGAVATTADTMYFRFERFVVYGIAVAAILLALRGTIRLSRKHFFIYSLPALAILSTLWSQDRVRTLTMAVLVFCLTAFSVYLCERFREIEQIELFNLVGIVAAVASYILIIFMPSAGIRHIDASAAWQGVFVHKNLLGTITIFFFVTAYYAAKGSGITLFLRNTYLFAMFVLIVMSQSRTAWLQFALLCGYFIFEFFYTKTGKKERALVFATAAFLAVLVAFVAITFTAQIAVALGKSPDMTGRAGIFQAIYPELWKRPLIGWGYQAFWLGISGESANVLLSPGGAELANAENGVLQMWLELGAAGTVIILMILFQSARNAVICLARNPTKFTRWNCAIILLSLMSLVNGDKFMYPDTIEWVLLVVAYINLSDEVRRMNQASVARITRSGVDMMTEDIATNVGVRA
jgi:exopolysaccharide production protein ExoQ